MSDFWLSKYKHGHKQAYPWDSVVSFVLRYAPKDRERHTVRILEVGCGTCSNLWFAAREGFSVAGVELSPDAIAEGRKRLSADGLDAELHQGSFTDLPFEDASFDLVIDRAGLTCADDDDLRRGLKEVERVTKQGGCFFFNCYADSHSSAGSGQRLGRGTVLEPTAGTLAGLDRITFLSTNDVRGLFAEGWSFEQLQRVEQVELAGADQSIHAEWRVIARRL